MWTEEKQKQLREGVIWKMGLCGCGSGTTWEIVKLVLGRAADHERNGTFYDEAHDASRRWVEFAAHVLDSQHLPEHGTGIGMAWLTESGILLKSFLDEFGTDDDEWPLWAESSPPIAF